MGTPKSIALALGFMFIWAAAMTPFIDVRNSYKTAYQVIGFIGVGLVCLACSSLAIYMSNLEEEARNLRGRIRELEDLRR